MRVGLNLHYLSEQSGGAGTYARELIPALLAADPELALTGFVTARAPTALTAGDHGGRVRFVTLPGDPLGASPLRAAQSVFAQWLAEPVRARRAHLDVVHGLANVAPVAGPVASVVTLLDLTWLHHPDAMSRRAAAGMRLLGLTSARRADRVIAISNAGRDDIVATLGLAEQRIDVTPLGVSAAPLAAPSLAPDALRRRLHLSDGPIVLCVAQLRAHKNLGALIRALALAGDGDAQLVIVGAPTAHGDDLRTLAGTLGIAARVHFPGWLADDDLDALYAAGACFVLPSLMEGFGLPIAEAMRRGVPVACSDRSSLPEVAGGAALLFDPTDPARIADAIDRLLGDPQLAAELVARGHRRVGELTWDATARATLLSYRRAAEM